MSSFLSELKGIEQKIRADVGDADIQQFRKIEVVTWVFALVGYGLAWNSVNIFAILALALAMFTRWTVMAHHILHRGFDKVPGAPARYTSKVFGKGWRRMWDWPEWMPPAGWHYEHNVLHHYRLGEAFDPDVPERNGKLLEKMKVPVAIRPLVTLFFACLWRPVYYGPQCVFQTLKTPKNQPRGLRYGEVFNPFHPIGKKVYTSVFLPYISYRFILLPMLFLPLGTEAALFVLINSLLAEVVANLHTFFIIVPNHAGDDVHRYSSPAKDSDEQLMRQIFGSVNYKTGGFWNDLLQGWLNYQIEHHLWPDLTPLQYQKAQPLVKSLCEKHGINYIQEPSWVRFRKMLNNIARKNSMIVVKSV